jgi:hypothetical protein
VVERHVDRGRDLLRRAVIHRVAARMLLAMDSVVVSNTVTYHRDGAQVAAPYIGSVESNGVLALGSALSTETATASFSFDRIVYSSQIDNIYDPRLEDLPSLALSASQPEFDMNIVPAPVTLPAAGWLLLSGIGGLLAVRGRKKGPVTRAA